MDNEISFPGDKVAKSESDLLPVSSAKANALILTFIVTSSWYDDKHGLIIFNFCVYKGMSYMQIICRMWVSILIHLTFE
jgi:hypothetical protein